MNNLFTIKTALILFLLIMGAFSLKAQAVAAAKDSTKTIVVVTPGEDANKPSNTTTITPAVTTPIVAAPAIAKPVTPAYLAPTMAERTAPSNYMQKTVKRVYTPAVAPVNTSTASASAQSVTTTVTTTKTTKNGITDVKNDTTVVKKDTLLAKTDTTKKDTLLAKKDTVAKDSIVHVSNQIIFAEVGGPGLAISANYDTRFFNKRDGWGYRVGAGYFGSGGNTVFTIPIQINYLIGIGDGSTSFFELGAGTTFLNSTGDNKGNFWEFDRVTGFIATATIGYRYQPASHRLNLRIGFVPIVYDEGIIPAGGLSVGYSFP